MIRKVTSIVVFAAVALVTAACLEDISGTRPLTLNLSANASSAAVGEDVTLTFAATGTNLVRVAVEFGDGEVLAREYNGPVELTDFVVYQYDSVGTFVVRAEATDVTGSVSDSLTVTIS